MLFKTDKDYQPEKRVYSRFRLDNKGLASQQIILIAVILIALVAAFLVTKIVIQPMFSKGSTEKVAKADDKAKDDKKEKDKDKGKDKKKDDGHDKEKKDSHDGGHGEEGGESNIASNIYQVDGIIVNPAATGGSRFLTTNIGFEMSDEASMEMFKSQEIKIRDALISILSSKTVTELSDLQSREKVRQQILSTVNQICQPAQAEAIYFVDYVLQ